MDRTSVRWKESLDGALGILREHKAAAVALLAFGIVYGLICLPNQALFRTHALDLGLYTHACWNYAHFQFSDGRMVFDDSTNLLADHFDLHLMLWSPLMYVFGQWTLLIVQIIALLLGGLGAYRYALAMGGTKTIAFMAMCMLLGFFGSFDAMATEFHSNVVACMALPWYMLAGHQGRWRRVWWLLLFMLAGKENIGFWLCFVIAGHALLGGTSKVVRGKLLVQAVACFLWSFIVVGWVMPALSTADRYAHFEYGSMGTSLGDMALNIVLHPFTAFRALFSDITDLEQRGTEVKLEFIYLLLVSGGWVFTRRWQYMLMLLPLLMQKMYTHAAWMWSSLGHYCTDFGPLLVVVYVHHVTTSITQRWKTMFMVAGAVCCLAVSQYTWDFPVHPNQPERRRFYQQLHWTREYDLTPVHQAIDRIPDGASVSAQSPAVPHLIDRDRLYMFPKVDDAEYILLMPLESLYPLNPERYAAHVAELRGSPQWEPVMDQREVLLFHRRTSTGHAQSNNP